MAAKHTPGPWGQHRAAGIEYVHRDNNPHLPLARCYSGGVDGGRELAREEVKANARLIAAAPELLETVKALRESLVSAGVSGVSARIRAADELIARIEEA